MMFFRINRCGLLVIILILFIGLCLMYHQYTTAPLVNPDVGFYGIMFDAGSTGTRIHAFHFTERNGNIILLDELFQQVKPGISSRADNPEEAQADIGSLLKLAEGFIPSSKWSTTPMALKATAGLRMLPTEKADNVLNHVRDEMDASVFKLIDDGVEIMDGKDEGAFSWYTTNFFLDRFQDVSLSEAVMDLGGGSTQVTSVASPKMITDYPEHIMPLTIHAKDVDVYTRSYLGLGLMVARLQITGGPDRSEDQTSITTDCLFKDEEYHFVFGGVDYHIIGSSEMDSVYEACSAAASKFVTTQDISLPAEISNRDITLISYYYDIAQDLDLIGHGNQLNVGIFTVAAEKACATKNHKEPLLCADVSYIIALLSEGFRFDKEKFFNVRKRIDDQEISWALGAMVNVIEHTR